MSVVQPLFQIFDPIIVGGQMQRIISVLAVIATPVLLAAGTVDDDSEDMIGDGIARVANGLPSE
jgi:hypothetical protein